MCVPNSCSSEKLTTYFDIILKKYNISINFAEDKCSVKQNIEYNTTDYYIM